METAPLQQNKRSVQRLFGLLGATVIGVLLVSAAAFSMPLFLAADIRHTQSQPVAQAPELFPVTVDSRNKTIVENPQVNAFLEGPNSPMQAAAWNVQTVLGYIFDSIATAIAAVPWYQNLGAVDGRFVTIDAGMRKEQVASAFAKALGWTDAQKKEFLNSSQNQPVQIPEGAFSPGVYLVDPNTTPATARGLVWDHFYKDVSSHYGTSTEQMVPLNEALTVASLIEREAGGPDDMRIISGIIWNRLFIDMHLQIDATVQYAKANSLATTSWWPKVTPSDIARKSPYNTYLNPGLPPGPIASPSVAAILAALNPVKTSCLYYFHDANRQFHCSDTYAGHVALLKKYYGRGK